MSARVRYAPSPTGFQHIGGVRTALYNYLFAISGGGAFIVRVEDTDVKRSEDQFVDDLFDILNWLGVNINEYKNIGPHAPYVQSKRSHIYTQYAKKLLKTGNAYYCYTSDKDSYDPNKTYKNDLSVYDRSSRDLSKEEINKLQEQFRAQGKKPVLRLKLPCEGTISFSDMLLGTVTKNYKDIIIDPILIKSDGLPTYHFANVIDDYLMGITHVMRSQEWVPTTPVHVHLYHSFGWIAPIFCHLPMVLGDDGQKLSKRNGSASIRDLREIGVLPSALVNCIALLGWSFDDKREFFTLEELENVFKDGSIQKSSAQFSMKKLLWFNAHYIRKLDDTQLAKQCVPYLLSTGFFKNEQDAFDKAQCYAPLIRDRIELLQDVKDIIRPLFQSPVITKKHFVGENDDLSTIKIMKNALTVIRDIFDASWNEDVQTIESICKIQAKAKGYKLSQIYMPLRIAITGTQFSPPVVAFAKLMKKEDLLTRIDYALEVLS